MGILRDIIIVVEDYDAGLILKRELPDKIQEAITKNEDGLSDD